MHIYTHIQSCHHQPDQDVKQSHYFSSFPQFNNPFITLPCGNDQGLFYAHDRQIFITKIIIQNSLFDIDKHIGDLSSKVCQEQLNTDLFDRLGGQATEGNGITLSKSYLPSVPIAALFIAARHANKSVYQDVNRLISCYIYVHICTQGWQYSMENIVNDSATSL